jgi:hypothetical protein
MLAVIGARIRADRRLILHTSIAAIVAGFIQPHGIEAITDPYIKSVAIRSVWIAGPIFFCGLLGIVAAWMQGPGRYRDLDVCEMSAPLFGRQLARAKALMPCLIGVTVAFVYWGAQWIRGFAAPPSYFALALATVLASTLIALSATLRTGARSWMYIAFAAATAVICYVLAVYFDSILAGVLFCVATGFIALRQYGEALSRYDPVGRV